MPMFFALPAIYLMVEIQICFKIVRLNEILHQFKQLHLGRNNMHELTLHKVNSEPYKIKYMIKKQLSGVVL